MAAFNPIDHLTEHLAHGVHNLGSDQLIAVLCNNANPPVAADEVLADLVTIDQTDLSSRLITTTSSEQTAGVYKLVLEDLTLTASDEVPAFQYVAIYNDSAANDELLGWYDYGEEIVLGSGEQFVVDFDAINGMLDLTFVTPA